MVDFFLLLKLQSRDELQGINGVLWKWQNLSSIKQMAITFNKTIRQSSTEPASISTKRSGWIPTTTYSAITRLDVWETIVQFVVDVIWMEHGMDDWT
jgi:hypothetical protein